jgi:tyrosinase
VQYWNWGLSALTGLQNHAAFDGSDTSMSGDGEFIANKGDIFINAGDLPPIRLAAGTGGGCVKSGPFKDMKVNLGPVSLETPGGITVSNPEGPLAYNPRCLKRDLSTHINRAFSNGSAVLANVVRPTNVNDFQLQMQGIPGSGNIGIHGGGHFSLGGDPGRDFFTSPGDPMFYLHHAMIDRVWWLWQELSPRQRTQGSTAIAGTRTFLNGPPSPDATIEDILNMGYVGESRAIKDVLSTTGGPFCYIYL